MLNICPCDKAKVETKPQILADFKRWLSTTPDFKLKSFLTLIYAIDELFFERFIVVGKCVAYLIVNWLSVQFKPRQMYLFKKWAREILRSRVRGIFDKQFQTTLNIFKVAKLFAGLARSDHTGSA
jgi:hypothetical protein